MSSVQTALGPVPLEEIGPALTHEHLFINMMRERRGDGLLHDEHLIASELRVFADQGGSAVFDLTTAELTAGSTTEARAAQGPAAATRTRVPDNVRAVQRVSERTGVHVVLGTGRYRDPYLDLGLVDRLGVDGLAEEMIRDIEEGFPGTTARAGLIGEIGADKW